KASSRLAAGPAKATHIMPRRGFLNRVGSTMTGLAQPKPKNSSIKVPMGSKWTKGLRVSRPSYLGRGSPRRTATAAWAYSWMASTSRTAAARKIQSSKPLTGPPPPSLGRPRRAGSRRLQPRGNAVVAHQICVGFPFHQKGVLAVPHQHHGRFGQPVVVAGHGVVVRASAEH